MQYSLLFFASNEAEYAENKYELLTRATGYADKNKFTAVWVPERHFHQFGGLYPNPSVLAAALAVLTSSVRIRAGSVVLPLHNPLRVAEEWAVVDNLSGGRVDLGFAQGWAPRDFVLAPDVYVDRLSYLYKSIDIVKDLWRGNPIKLPDGNNKTIEVRVYPQPKQKELNVWLTCSGGEDRFKEAGALGANVLTALLFQTTDQLSVKLKAYRDARAANGYDPAGGHVTLMLHTLVGASDAEIRTLVRVPFIEYMRNSVDLWQQVKKDFEELGVEETEKLLSWAFERYFRTSALFGTPQSCLPMISRLRQAGVNEIACLLDFGVNKEDVLNNLVYLNNLRELSNEP